jgi:hypothetical protein
MITMIVSASVLDPDLDRKFGFTGILGPDSDFNFRFGSSKAKLSSSKRNCMLRAEFSFWSYKTRVWIRSRTQQNTEHEFDFCPLLLIVTVLLRCGGGT